jgi:hypothetical protein
MCKCCNHCPPAKVITKYCIELEPDLYVGRWDTTNDECDIWYYADRLQAERDKREWAYQYKDAKVKGVE